MKVKFLKLKNWLLITLMGAMGLGGCKSHKKIAEPVPDPQIEPDTVVVEPRPENLLMYGVPTMNYMIRGQVKDAQGRPVRDLRVNMLERGMEVTSDGRIEGDPEAIRKWMQNEGVSTDGEGRFVLKETGRPQEAVRLMVSDVDGPANGEYKGQLLEMEVTGSDVDKSAADGWFQGTYNKDVSIKIESK